MKPWLLVGGAILIAAIGWYALSPLFMEQRLDEAIPVRPAELPDTSPSPDPAPSIQPSAQPFISDPVPVIDTPIHPASGSVRIVRTDDQTTVRYENYKTINGPDVRVYLAKDLKATEYIDLGPIKGTEGNINYPVPAGVDVNDYRYVLTWCEDFSVLFNSADLSTIRTKP